MGTTRDQDVAGGPARPQIHQSWRRSTLFGVNRDLGRLAPDSADIEIESEFSTIAAPVLDDLERRLGDASALITLSDNQARLTRSWTPEKVVRRRFEEIGAVPGAGAAENQVGTNAIGLALEEGRHVVVAGDEHYQQTFEAITCAAAVVRNPLTRRTVGTIALATLDTGAGRQLLPLTVQAAKAVEQRLLDRASAADRLVLEALKIRCNGTHRSVVGVSRALMIANEPGMRLLPRLDQVLLWEQARETVETGHEKVVELVVDADHEPIPVRCVPVRLGDLTVGALIDFGPGEMLRSRRRASVTKVWSGSGRPPGQLLGRSPGARRLGERIATVAGGLGPVLVTGEPGAGKATVAHEILTRRLEGTTPRVVHCSHPAAVDALVRSDPHPQPVLLAHIEFLDTQTAHRLREWLRATPELLGRIAGTMNTSAATPPTRDNPLVDELGTTHVEVPALRFLGEDITPLAEHFVGRAGDRTRRINPEAAQLLIRYPWPGNIRQLRTVMSGVSETGIGDIELQDLPADLRRLATRRPLNPLEQAEADAILAALHACGNNKVRAAAMLQISRSRLYRKASAYGLVGEVLA